MINTFITTHPLVLYTYNTRTHTQSRFCKEQTDSSVSVSVSVTVSVTVSVSVFRCAPFWRACAVTYAYNKQKIGGHTARGGAGQGRGF